MNRLIKNLPIEELKELLKKETKAFMDGIDKGLKAEELQAIRARMKEISALLEEKAKRKGNS